MSSFFSFQPMEQEYFFVLFFYSLSPIFYLCKSFNPRDTFGLLKTHWESARPSCSPSAAHLFLFLLELLERSLQPPSTPSLSRLSSIPYFADPAQNPRSLHPLAFSHSLSSPLAIILFLLLRLAGSEVLEGIDRKRRCAVVQQGLTQRRLCRRRRRRLSRLCNSSQEIVLATCEGLSFSSILHCSPSPSSDPI